MVESKYDTVFPSDALQLDVYKFVEDSIGGIFEGFNSTIFAYGQTGSGKTFTMFGPAWEEHIMMNQAMKHKKAFDKYLMLERDSEGIIPRAIRDVFSQLLLKQ